MPTRLEIQQQIARALAYDDGRNPDAHIPNPLPGIFDNVSYPAGYVRDQYMNPAETVLFLLESKGVALDDVYSKISSSAEPKGLLRALAES